MQSPFEQFADRATPQGPPVRICRCSRGGLEGKRELDIPFRPLHDPRDARPVSLGLDPEPYLIPGSCVRREVEPPAPVGCDEMGLPRHSSTHQRTRDDTEAGNPPFRRRINHQAVHGEGCWIRRLVVRLGLGAIARNVARRTGGLVAGRGGNDPRCRGSERAPARSSSTVRGSESRGVSTIGSCRYPNGV